MKSITKKNELTPEERTELAECEQGIKDGLSTFYDVGMKLVRISDKRLYRETHTSFEHYCTEKWKMTARHAYRLCEAAEVINKLPKSATQWVTHERQARELAKASPKKRAKVIEIASADGPATAKKIREAVREVEPPTPAAEPELEEIDHDQALKAFELDVRQLVDAIPAGAPMARYAMVLRVAARNIEESAMRAMGNPVQMNAYTR